MRRCFATFMLLCLSALPAAAQRLDAATLAALRDGGHVIFFRHGETGAQGSDRAQAVMGDCSTQRNLNDAGRRQVQQLGEAFRKLGIPVARVQSSEFCRCREHAQAMFGKDRVEINPALSVPASYPSVSDADRELNNRQLARLLGELPAKGANTVLVSHGINILLLTGWHPNTQGEAAVFKPDGRGAYQRVATVLPDGWLAP